jgi:divalent metal cation (Fe/Co/Zn/Cd) transporter
MPDAMSTGIAHKHITEAEDAVRALFPEQEAYITTHVEPDLHHCAHPDEHHGIEDPLSH